MTDFVQKEENLADEVSSQVREIPCEEGHCQIGLKRKPEEDPVLGDIVRLRRSRDEVPPGRVVEGEQCDEEALPSMG